MTLGTAAAACSASTAGRSQLRRPRVTESHTSPLTEAAALKKMAEPRGPTKFEQGGFTSARRGARRPGTAMSRGTKMNMPHHFRCHHSLLLDPAVQKSQEPPATQPELLPPLVSRCAVLYLS
jgi:hypothetical protein